MAEGEGFEPPDPCRSSVFKTDAIDHSANLPYMNRPHKTSRAEQIFCFTIFFTLSIILSDFLTVVNRLPCARPNRKTFFRYATVKLCPNCNNFEKFVYFTDFLSLKY